MFKKFLLLIIVLLLSVSICAENNPETLSIVPQGIVNYKKSADDAGTMLSYQFKIENKTPEPILLYLGKSQSSPFEEENLPGKEVPPSTLKPKCDFSGKNSIAANGVCYIEYQAPIPVNNTSLTEKFNATLSFYDGLDFYHSKKFGVTVTGMSKKAHLIFKQNDKMIHSLVLAKGDTSSFKLVNNGLSVVTKLTFSQLPNGFTNNCEGIGGLNSNGGSCVINYSIPAKPVEDTEHFTVSGVGSDNSPVLDITVTAKGHFLLKKEQGTSKEPIGHELDLGPSDSGAIEISNTGGGTITNLDFKDLPPYFIKHCPSQLMRNASCNITYDIPKEPEESTKNFIITGKNVDNPDYKLKVVISSQGHLTFEKDSIPISNLNVGPGYTDTLSLVNTGGSSVTNLDTPSFPAGFNNHCKSIKELLPKASCNITYTIPKSPTQEIKDFTVKGKSVGVDKSAQINIDVGLYNQAGNVFNLNGVAVPLDNKVRLTPDTEAQKGNLVSATKFDFTKDFTVETTLEFGEAGGADGIGIGIENDPNGRLAIGKDARSVGIVPTSNGVFFAMLDFPNSSLTFEKSVDGSTLKQFSLPTSFAWNNPASSHNVTMHWSAAEGIFTLTVDKNATYKTDRINLGEYLGPTKQGYLIIGGGTGGVSAEQFVTINAITN